jgi:hypothetical protein
MSSYYTTNLKAVSKIKAPALKGHVQAGKRTGLKMIAFSL